MIVTRKIKRQFKVSKLARKEEVEFYLFISPWLVGFILFGGGPMIASLIISFTKWPLLSSPKWIGLGNYTKLFNDPLFYKSLINTAYYSFASVALGIIAAFIAALLLNQKLTGITWFRTIYYLPSVVSGIAIAILFIWIYNPQFGLFNYLLSKLGIVGPSWLWDDKWAMPALIIMSLWGIGGNMVIFLAGLQGVPQSLYEASKIDGANWWQQFRHITLSVMSPVIFLVLIISLIGSFQIFLQSYVMTRGGPGNATLTCVLYIYQNAFQWWKMGYGATLAWILLIILLILTLIQFKISRYWVYYEARQKGR